MRTFINNNIFRFIHLILDIIQNNKHFQSHCIGFSFVRFFFCVQNHLVLGKLIEMVEETAKDYVNYLHQIDFAKEIGPICTNVDDILIRMDEFESSLSIIQNISASTSLPNIIECKKGIQQYSDRIDKIQLLLDRINTDITALELNVTKAEDELGYNNTGFKGFFKPFLGKIVKNDRSNRSESIDVAELKYKPIESFKASDYFGESSLNLSTEEHGTTNESKTF